MRKTIALMLQWNCGSEYVVIYSGALNAANVNSYIPLYGCTRNTLIEHYIVEVYSSYNSSSVAQKNGSVTSDGGTFDILQATRTNQPSIDGIAMSQKFCSVRMSKQMGSIIIVKNLFDVWAKYGQKLGIRNYQIRMDIRIVDPLHLWSIELKCRNIQTVVRHQISFLGRIEWYLTCFVKHRSGILLRSAYCASRVLFFITPRTGENPALAVDPY